MSTSAHLTALTVYENVRTLLDHEGKANPKSLAMDVHLYVPNNPDGSLALLRYYNHENIAFSDCPGAFFIHANVISTKDMALPKGHTTLPDDPHCTVDLKEYTLFGEIVWLSPISNMDAVDVKQKAWLHVCGPAYSVNDATATFEMNPRQWTSVCQKEGSLPVQAYFPESRKYTKSNKKPLPKNGGLIEANGWIEGFGTKNEVRLAIESITFVAAAPLNVPRTPSSIKNSATTGGSSGKKMRFSYSDLNSSGSPTKAGASTSTASAMTPSKRPSEDANEA